jgi:hypothetical protein
MTDKFIGWGLLKSGPFRFPLGPWCATQRLRSPVDKQCITAAREQRRGASVPAQALPIKYEANVAQERIVVSDRRL